MYVDRFGTRFVKSTSDGSNGGYGIESFAALRSNDTLALVVINKRLDSAVTARVTVADGGALTSCATWQMTEDAPLKAPSNGSAGFVEVASPQLSGNAFTRQYPPASITLMQITRVGGMSGVGPREAPRRATSPPIAFRRVRNGAIVQVPGGHEGEMVRIRDVSGRLVGRGRVGRDASSIVLSTDDGTNRHTATGVAIIDVDKKARVRSIVAF
jgi:hypothetical protein